MERTKLISALRRMQVETGSLVCLGCGHEHNCSTQGCAIIRAAVEELSRDPRWYPIGTPPPDYRSVFVCRGSPGHMTVCVGYYSHDSGTWREQHNWFATLLPDGLFWTEMPDLPEVETDE